jgi:hypothetical protein
MPNAYSGCSPLKHEVGSKFKRNKIPGQKMKYYFFKIDFFAMQPPSFLHHHYRSGRIKRCQANSFFELDNGY